VLPVSILVEENSKCFLSIAEMKNNRNILIPIKNNFDYFSRNSLTPEIVCKKTKNESKNGNEIHNSNAANLMAQKLH